MVVNETASKAREKTDITDWRVNNEDTGIPRSRSRVRRRK
jgi:hypothetical protein